MDKPETRVSNAVADAGLFGRLSKRAKRNKYLAAVTVIIVAIIGLSSLMALTGLENSQSLFVVLFVLVTAGLFCTLGVIFDALDDR